MSYEEFRKRIDIARQILVGAVPSPAGQIDQITFALMYKFMNDIDDKSAALPGGKRVYFIGEYEQYNWHRLMDVSLGAHDRSELYRNAIQNMAKNENIPELFRSIYQNAFLPFNSPTVLNLFLKEIDKFNHGESDDIGDAYEYLLSITGAQGDVGQFRTPRHIIKFIVDAVCPTKDDKILDPAVGTAGFLIAAYNHVKSHHDGKDASGNRIDEKRLSADDLFKIHHNYRGFDIDPTMVRTAKVNMYLHGFKTPDIINHDSLSSEDYWNDRYDVILANPPFMTPKGGIQPHKKFGIAANRAEVLFVDYIASHLKPSGRAGIVVPEGVVFQGGKAYKELRKNLVDNYLYAVVSLPAGVFQPYSGVKTSVLLFDKELVKSRDEILFIRIENDGLSLSTQRRKINGSQIPEALQAIKSFKLGEEIQSPSAHVVSRNMIGETGDYNLSGDRYRITQNQVHKEWPMVQLGDILDYEQPTKYIVESTDYDDSYDTPVLTAGKSFILGYTNEKTGIFDNSKLPVIIFDDFTTATKLVDFPFKVKSSAMKILLAKNGVDIKYVYYMMQKLNYKPAEHKRFWISEYSKLKIPLPPIEKQQEIISTINGYQKIIDSARVITETYQPQISINPEWPTDTLGNLFDMQNGRAFKSSEWETVGLPIIRIANLNDSKANYNYFNGSYDSRVLVTAGDLLFSWSGTRGTSFGPHLWTRGDGLLNQHIFKLTAKNTPIDPTFAYFYLKNIVPEIEAKAHGTGGLVHITKSELSNFTIPTPPMSVQKEIVKDIQSEIAMIDANKSLIELFSNKIKSKVAEVWGD